MREDEQNEEAPDLLDLKEIMRDFGVDEWTNLGPLENPQDIFYEGENPEELLIEEALERLAWATALPGWLEKVRRLFAEMW